MKAFTLVVGRHYLPLLGVGEEHFFPFHRWNSVNTRTFFVVFFFLASGIDESGGIKKNQKRITTERYERSKRT
jgi:hypothetical protein